MVEHDKKKNSEINSNLPKNIIKENRSAAMTNTYILHVNISSWNTRNMMIALQNFKKTCQSSIELHDNYEKLWKRKIEIFPAPEMKE